MVIINILSYFIVYKDQSKTPIHKINKKVNRSEIKKKEVKIIG